MSLDKYLTRDQIFGGFVLVLVWSLLLYGATIIYQVQYTLPLQMSDKGYCYTTSPPAGGISSTYVPCQTLTNTVAEAPKK
jgi:hypothetical protein